MSEIDQVPNTGVGEESIATPAADEPTNSIPENQPESDEANQEEEGVDEPSEPVEEEEEGEGEGEGEEENS